VLGFDTAEEHSLLNQRLPDNEKDNGKPPGDGLPLIITEADAG
jgi:hypothetical protein